MNGISITCLDRILYDYFGEKMKSVILKLENNEVEKFARDLNKIIDKYGNRTTKKSSKENNRK